MSTNRVKTPQSRCRAGVARCDITPPVGIYHRMWGAALHDQATGVHRPLTATLLWLAPETGDLSDARIVISLDHCILDTAEIKKIRDAIATSTGCQPAHVQVTLTHTHGSGWMSRTRSHLPGGELIGPYLDGLVEQLAGLAKEAQSRIAPVTITYGTGKCTLAAHRDYRDLQRNGFVCGYNPDGIADDTLLVARITDLNSELIATVVNYACHPTTLAWENTLISPDWIGAMREVIEQQAGGYCLFLQGASGELGPREGFVGDPDVADRNGHQVGYSALATLASMGPPGTEFCYTGPVISGATLGTWKYQPLPADELAKQAAWTWRSITVELPYRHDLPTVEQTTSEREHWQAEEAKARSAGNEAQLRECRAQIEQRTRQLTRLNALAPGKSWPLPVEIGLVGDAIWILLPGELYQVFQMTLRSRLAPRAVFVATLTNDWQPGYIPPASSYGYGIYQEIIAATAPGCLETLTESVSREVEQMLDRKLTETHR